MNIPKKHHLIPNFLLRNFSINLENSSKQIWLYRKNSNNPIKVNTKDAFVQNNFYTLPDGDISIEKLLSTRESCWAQTLTKILEKRAIEKHHTPILIDFIHTLNCRGHVFRSEMRHIMGMMMNFLGKSFQIILKKSLLLITSQQWLKKQEQ